ncbi:RCC1 domain-containing protein 1 isoform X4 [Thamnophis elegans]|uniref:RCC1 domain-containing protein 1 isoform X4 n=1 Tax=Thamnophis elegans TaxID=35005 RepID=UPI0013783F2C|nr:RCC1 domain-containing protein 1 isoform X4 [Thamnophis elegans]
MTPGGESGWFGFGFRWTGGAEGGPEPLSAEGLGPVRRVRPSWSFAAVVAAGGPGRVRLQGAVAAALPEDCLDALPSETHVLLLREAALEAWPAATESDSLLDGRPAWRKELRAEEAAAIELPLVPGGYVAPRPPFFTALPAALPARRLLLGLEHALLLAAGGALFSWGGGRCGRPVLVGLERVGAAGAALQKGQRGCSNSRRRGRFGPAESPPLRAQRCSGQRQAGGGGFGRAGRRRSALRLSAGLPRPAGLARGGRGPGHLYTWGWGKYGQLGHQDAATSDWPRRVCYFVERNLRVQDVVCGPWNTFVQAAAAKSGP